MRSPTKNPRKLFQLLTVGAIFSILLTHTGRAEKVSPFPPPEILQTGDLIWPKPPGAIVPYNSRPGEATNSDASRWEREKERYLSELRAKPNPTVEEKERYTRLQNMTYRQFIAQYEGGQAAGEITTFGTGNFFVGHVGIVQIVNGSPTIVEAMIGHGVRRLTYSKWLEDRSGERFWVGRLKNLSAEKRTAIAETAARYIGRPYRFWNFNLADDSGFYCSKLAWFSILKAAGFAVDDQPNPHRLLWFSPKQLMRSRHLEFIVNPGKYGAPIHH